MKIEECLNCEWKGIDGMAHSRNQGHMVSSPLIQGVGPDLPQDTSEVNDG